MVKAVIKRMLNLMGIDPNTVMFRLNRWSVGLALREQDLWAMMKELRAIEPDLSRQESREIENYNAYWELKRRGQQTFQCRLMAEALSAGDGPIRVADIGDSAGTHTRYLRALLPAERPITAISINVDPRAIQKIKERGLVAIEKRAEAVTVEDLGGTVDMVMSFQMLEHLHDPTIFFRRMAQQRLCTKMLITVPYRRTSRVGMHHIRNRSAGIVYAEDVHVFELSPEDWTLLIAHSGWQVIHSKIYHQYPRRIPILSQLLAWYWRRIDYEGFWGAVMVPDPTHADRYQDWAE